MENKNGLLVNSVSLEELIELHVLCDKDFVPPLSSRVVIVDYCKKLINNAEIIGYFKDNQLQGVVAVYCNDNNSRRAFISSFCLYSEIRGMGLGNQLLAFAKSLAQEKGMQEVFLEVGKSSQAVRFYERHGFAIKQVLFDTYIMGCELSLAV